MLVKERSKKIDIKYLVENFKKLAGYDISENRITKNLNVFLALLREEKLNG